jgi:CBS domain-containing protein
MTVERICGNEVYLARGDESAQVAGKRMQEHNVGMLVVVVDDDRQPVGIVTDRDLAIRVVGTGLDPMEVRIDQIMSGRPKTVPIDTPIEDALDMMRHHGVRRLPVLDRSGKLTGVISLDDVLKQLANELKEASALLDRSQPRR